MAVLELETERRGFGGWTGNESERTKSSRKPEARSQLTDEVRQQEVAIRQHKSNLKAVMDQNVELREQQNKNNGPSEKFRK
jgi:LmbE family N-acetylglucosaminyl deacetylase